MKFKTNNAKTSNNNTRMVVHPGVFHADDVFCVAFATIKYGEVDVVRTAKFNEDDFDYVCDIGRKYDGVKFFDHHQCVTPDEKGVIPSAVNLLVKGLFTEEFDELNEKFLRGIAVQDNGQVELFSTYPNLLGGWVHVMNPVWDSEESPDTAFARAVELAIPMAEAALERVRSDRRADGELAKATHHFDGKVLEFERFFPWIERVTTLSVPLFVLFESNRGGWNVQCVPPSKEDSFKQRLPLPEEWASGENHPKGMTFCHAGRFLASFETREDALAALHELI